jgi:hypothetical protein
MILVSRKAPGYGLSSALFTVGISLNPSQASLPSASVPQSPMTLPALSQQPLPDMTTLYIKKHPQDA